MVLGDMKSALPNLERVVGEVRRAQDPSLLAGVLTHLGQVSVAMGRLEDGRRSYEEALMAGQKVSTEANLLMCGPHTGLAEVLLEGADLAGATHHAAKALDFAGRSPTRSPVLYARTTAAQVLLAAGDTKAAIKQLEEAQAFERGSSDSRFSSFLSSVKLKLYCRDRRPRGGCGRCSGPGALAGHGSGPRQRGGDDRLRTLPRHAGRTW